MVRVALFTISSIQMRDPTYPKVVFISIIPTYDLSNFLWGTDFLGGVRAMAPMIVFTCPHHMCLYMKEGGIKG